MRVLFGADDKPTEIKDTALFNRLISEAVDISDEPEECVIDDLTGLLADCYTVTLYNDKYEVGEIAHVETETMESIVYGEYEILEKE